MTFEMDFDYMYGYLLKYEKFSSLFPLLTTSLTLKEFDL